jgi:hypothetical protein
LTRLVLYVYYVFAYMCRDFRPARNAFEFLYQMPKNEASSSRRGLLPTADSRAPTALRLCGKTVRNCAQTTPRRAQIRPAMRIILPINFRCPLTETRENTALSKRRAKLIPRISLRDPRFSRPFAPRACRSPAASQPQNPACPGLSAARRASACDVRRSPPRHSAYVIV